MNELLASLLIAAVGLAGGAGPAPPAAASAPVPPAGPPPPAAVPRLVPRILCRRPASLELRRFEDRSAQVMCGGRVLVRIAVPG